MRTLHGANLSGNTSLHLDSAHMLLRPLAMEPDQGDIHIHLPSYPQLVWEYLEVRRTKGVIQTPDLTKMHHESGRDASFHAP